jgi:hypothetical protein
MATASNVRARLRIYTDVQLHKTAFCGTIFFNNGDSVGSYSEVVSSKNNIYKFGTVKKYKDKHAEGEFLNNGEDIFTEGGVNIGEIPGYLDCPAIGHL